jgi:sugar phosphate isomerase/epimerase
MLKDKPVIGAAFASLDMLALHADWLRAAPRDIELQSFAWPTLLMGDTAAATARARKLLEGCTGRLGLHGPFMGFTIDCPDPGIAALAQARMLKALEVCEALGADQMVLHSPYSAWDHAILATEPAQALSKIERTRFLLAPVIARAEAIGCTLVIENIEDIDPRARLGLAAALKSPNVRLSLDTGHALFAHVKYGAPPVDVFVHAAGAALEHVHLQDADGQADRHWHPGLGALNWYALFAALAELPRWPRLILEVNDERGLPRGAAHLAALGLAV